MSRNKHVIIKRERERLVRERRATKLADKRAKAARRRGDQPDAPAPDDGTISRDDLE